MKESRELSKRQEAAVGEQGTAAGCFYSLLFFGGDLPTNSQIKHMKAYYYL